MNLLAVGTRREVEHARNTFTDATLRAARAWRVPPAAAADGTPQSSIYRVPVKFTIDSNHGPVGYGQWSAYLPGPRHRPDWLDAEYAGNDALVAGGAIYPVGQGPRLLAARVADADESAQATVGDGG